MPAPAALPLFPGADLSAWQRLDGGPADWAVRGGVLIVSPSLGDLLTRGHFGDCQLHLEFLCPIMPGAHD